MHKLEFLILESQDKRTNTESKFKTIIDHIIHSLPKTEIGSKVVQRTLRDILMMQSSEDVDTTQKEPPLSGPIEKDFLFEALGAGSKPFNNMENGFVSNSGGGFKNGMGEQDTGEVTHRKIDLLRSVKSAYALCNQLISGLPQENSTGVFWRRSKERFAIQNPIISEIDGGKVAEKLVKPRDSSVANVEFIKHQYHELRHLLKQETKKKRDVKRKRKSHEQKDNNSYKMPENREFNNDAFDNLKISKKLPSNSVALETNGGSHFRENSFNGNCLNERMYNVPEQNLNPYKIKLQNFDFADNQYHQSLQSQFQGPREDLFNFPKTSLPQSRDPVCYQQYTYNDPAYPDERKKNLKSD
jgi:hypothetical protein